MESHCSKCGVKLTQENKSCAYAKWCKSCYNAYARKYLEEHPKAYEHMKELTRNNGRLKKLGITPEEVEKIRKKQNNKCAICEKKFIEEPRVDHNHKTGKIRGLLCSKCNRGLGFFKDNPMHLQRAIIYLNLYEPEDLITSKRRGIGSSA